MKIKAFLYDSEYYILPPEYENGAAFHKENAGKTVTLKWLREKKCMAPYFVADFVKNKKLLIEADKPAFDCVAEVMPMKEYNDRLRALIPGHCRDCRGYIPDDDPASDEEGLKGHHEEITLDDVCFLKAQQNDFDFDFPPFDHFVKRAVGRFGRLGLEKLTDEGNAGKAEKKYAGMIWDECAFPSYPVWFDKTKNGKYRLVTTSFNSTSDALVNEIIITALSEKYGDTWEFYNYLPKGFFAPGAADDFRVFYKQDDDNGRYINIAVDINGDREDYDHYDRCMYYFYGLYGENRIKAVALEINTGLDDLTGYEEASFDEFSKVVDRVCAGLSKEELRYPPVMSTMSFRLGDGEEFEETEEFYKEHMELHTYRSFELCAALSWRVMNGVKPGDFRSEGAEGRLYAIANNRLPCARLSLSLGGVTDGTVFDHPELLDGLQNSIQCLNDALKKSGGAKMFAQRYDSKLEGLEVWFVVTSYAKFMYSVRRLAPLFGVYPGSVEIYTASGKGDGRYELGFEMKKTGDETEMLSELSDMEE